MPAANEPPATATVATAPVVRRMTRLVRRAKMTIGQPRSRAIWFSRESGLTATGCPTESSIGRSLIESL